MPETPTVGRGARTPRREISDRSSTGRRRVIWALSGIAAIATALFIVLTVVVTRTPSFTVDPGAFETAGDLRAPWLDDAARLVTTLGLSAIVGPVLLLGAAYLIRRHYQARAAAVLAGGAFAWIIVSITKGAVDRARPPAPLVHTVGQSFPSGHAASSIGYLALAIALTVTIRTRAGRIAVVAAGALLAVLIGLSRIYLRAHYDSDVLAGEAIAVGTYAIAAISAIIWQARRPPARRSGAVAVR
jgi:membrane-associated phospholipid phosphatase